MFRKMVKVIGMSAAVALFIPISQASAVPITGLNLGQQSTIQNPLPFYCTVTNAKNSDRVYMKNRAVMVTGFKQHGALDISVKKLNSVYFNSYHDPNYPNEDGIVVVTVVNNQAEITCQVGIGSGRTLIPGNYGVP